MLTVGPPPSHLRTLNSACLDASIFFPSAAVSVHVDWVVKQFFANDADMIVNVLPVSGIAAARKRFDRGWDQNNGTCGVGQDWAAASLLTLALPLVAGAGGGRWTVNALVCARAFVPSPEPSSSDGVKWTLSPFSSASVLRAPARRRDAFVAGFSV